MALSILPDADVLMHRWVRYEHPFGHRGYFHSLSFFVPLALLFAVGWHRRRRRHGASRTDAAWVFCATVSALISHALLDMLTDGGLGVALLYPASATRWFFPWQPLPVSPMSVTAFLGPWGLRVLCAEAFVIVPAVLITWLLKGRPRSAAPEDG